MDLSALHFNDVLLPLMVVLATVFFGLLVRKALFYRLHKWAAGTDSKLDDIVIAATRGPFIVWWLILGIYLALEVSVMPQEWVALAGKALLVLIIGSVTISVAHIATGMIKINAYRWGSALPLTSLTDNIARIIIFGVGVLIILNSLGISIMPVLATLGVGGLAVALALQDTLANLFAGFYIIFSRQIRVGDFVRLESGQEGYVTDINWRMTKVKMLANNDVLIPNHKLTQSLIINYHMPEKEMSFLVEVGVSYDSDLKHVERVTIETAGEVLKEVPGGVTTFNPFIRYHTFGDFAIGFTVILRAKEFTDQYLLKHEFVKRLHERYNKEGIVIPFPIRDVRMSKSPSL